MQINCKRIENKFLGINFNKLVIKLIKRRERIVFSKNERAIKENDNLLDY